MEFFHPNVIVLLFWLMVGHAFADFPLQGDFMAQAKNRNTDMGRQWWTIVLPMHGLIHGGFVLLFTGDIVFAVMEVIIHCLIDYLKNDQKISFHMDQFLHILTKVVWAVMTMVFATPLFH